MDFWALPPEITSALIHSGPGAGSLIEAAAMWHLLGAAVEDSVRGYTSELSELTGTWRGQSSLAMVAAVEPYLAWLRVTAQQCQQIASAVQIVTAAFELTHWTVVHPAVVTANRTRLAFLLATNFFGINFPAIAETETEYHTMWVNNSAAMTRYAATSASAVVLPQFSPPPPITQPTALAAQPAAVPAANASSQTASTLASTLAASAAADPINLGITDPTHGYIGLLFGGPSAWANQFIAGGFPINLLSYLAQFNSASALQGVGGEIGLGLSQGADALAAGQVSLANSLSAMGSAPAPTGALGVGVSVGKLTAPPSVVGLMPASETPVRLASAVSAVAPEPPVSPSIPLAPMRMTPPVSASGRRRDGRDYDNIEYGAELSGTVMKRPPSAG